MSSPRPHIVISNDDGIDAPGIQTLAQLLSESSDCRLVAPDGPQSGVGHVVAATSDLQVQFRTPEAIAVGGTPADCARLALGPDSTLLEDWSEARRAHACWLVAGINHGANLGVDLYISGTAAAAREAAILGFPAIAISQYVRRHGDVDWDDSARRARPVLEQLLDRPPAPGAFWNVNLPHPAPGAGPSEVVFCPPDPSPQPVRYARRGSAFRYSGDYHARPRLPRHDVDVCFGGAVAVSEIHLFGE